MEYCCVCVYWNASTAPDVCESIQYKIMKWCESIKMLMWLFSVIFYLCLMNDDRIFSGGFPFSHFYSNHIVATDIDIFAIVSTFSLINSSFRYTIFSLFLSPSLALSCAAGIGKTFCCSTNVSMKIWMPNKKQTSHPNKNNNKQQTVQTRVSDHHHIKRIWN